MGIRGRIVAKSDQPFQPSPVMIDTGNHGRFLLALIDAGGTVPPALGVAAELVRRGHQVRILADPTVAAAASAAGCAFTPWQEAPHFNSLAEQTALIAAFEGRNPYRALRALKHFAGRGMTQRFADEVIATTQSFPVDAVLPTASTWDRDRCPGHRASHGRLDGKHLPAPDDRTPTSRYRMVSRTQRSGQGEGPTGAPAAQWFLARTLPRVNPVVTSFGHPPLHDLFDYLDRCTRVLVMTSPSFDFPPPRLPDNVRYVGPQVDDPHWATQRPWQRKGEEPLVLVATSSVYPGPDRPAGADCRGPGTALGPRRSYHWSGGGAEGRPCAAKCRSCAGSAAPTDPDRRISGRDPCRPRHSPQGLVGWGATGLHTDGPRSEGQHSASASSGSGRAAERQIDAQSDCRCCVRCPGKRSIRVGCTPVRGRSPAGGPERAQCRRRSRSPDQARNTRRMNTPQGGH